MSDRIMTLHPEGKQGTNIDRNKYDVVRAAIVDILQAEEELTFAELGNEVEKRLSDSFQGSVSWYYTTVKLDLEARGIIQRVPRSRPQRIRLAHGHEAA